MTQRSFKTVDKTTQTKQSLFWFDCSCCFCDSDCDSTTTASEFEFVVPSPPVIPKKPLTRKNSVLGILKKHSTFLQVVDVDETLFVSELPGTTDELCQNLIAEGYEYAHQLLYVYVVSMEDKHIFSLWMERRFGAKTEESSIIYFAL